MWTELIPENEIKNNVTEVTVDFAERFGKHLGKNDFEIGKDGKSRNLGKLTTNQLRKFFGEVKRQQLLKFNKSDFVMLKPKLAYAVARADKGNKIQDFYYVLSNAIDKVTNEKEFKNFIKIFEAIVAYHKAAEENCNLDNE